MRLASILLLAALPGTFVFGQTPAAKKPVVHHAAAASTVSTLPPNIPKVPGIAKPLFALRYIDTRIGTGSIARNSVLGASQADSKIMFYTVRYTGWLAKDGTKFDSSFDHPGGEPITFPYGVHQVIPGWDTGFEGMHIGGKRRLFIPWQLAYGDTGRAPRIPAKADLIFDVELVNVSDKPPTLPTPPAPPIVPKVDDPAAPPPTTTPPPANPPTN
jgi:peptidylprolyl isomerase